MQIMISLGMIALLAVASLAAAGSRGNPEVVDPRGDAFNTFENAPEADAAVDLLGLWIVERQDSFEVHWRVRDLGSVAEHVAFQYTANWEVDGYTLLASVLRWHDGASAQLSRAGQISALHVGDAAVQFAEGPDEVVYTIPRTVSDGTVSFFFTDGTQFVNPRARAWIGDETEFGISAVHQADSTMPGRTFEFGRSGAQNPHAAVQPVASVVRAAPGASTPVRVQIMNPLPFELDVILQASTAAPGWGLRNAAEAVTVPADSTSLVSFDVKAPSAAKAGDVALIEVRGGSRPVAVVATVGNPAALLAGIGSAAAEPPETLTGSARLHLVGSTVSPSYGIQPGDQEPVFPAGMTALEPAGDASEQVPVAFETNTEPLGVWTAQPARAPIMLDGPATLTIYGQWSAAPGLKLRALVGPAPLPLAWDAASPPAGTAVLPATLSAPSATGSGSLVASGPLSGVTIGAGQKLAVSIVSTVDATDGTLSASVFSVSAPSRLEYTFTGAGAGAPRAAATGSGPTVLLASADSPPEAPPVSTVVEGPDGIAVPLASANIPAALAVGDTSKPSIVESFSGSFGVGADGSTSTHPFVVVNETYAVRATLDGSHSTYRWDDHQLTLRLTHVDPEGNRTLVREAQSWGPDQALDISPADLDAVGRGQFEAAVTMQRYGTAAGEDALYDLTIEQQPAAIVSQSRVVAASVWDHRGLPNGDYVVRATQTQGAAESVSERVLTKTDRGVTIPPVAAFQSASEATAGNAVVFTDRSSDADGSIVAWSWNFGDGATSSDASPTHTFAAEGAYLVTLTVHDDFGASASSRALPVLVSPAGTPLVPVDGASAPIGLTPLPDSVGNLRGGTMLYYGALYAAGIPHLESFAPEWLRSELAGLIGAEFLASSGAARYAFGYANDDTLGARWQPDGSLAADFAGAAIGYQAGVAQHGTSGAEAVGLAAGRAVVGADAFDLGALRAGFAVQDGFADGLLEGSLTWEGRGVRAERTMTLLQGTLHADVRTLVEAQDPLAPVRVDAKAKLATLAADAWLAYPTEDGVMTVPASTLGPEGIAVPVVPGWVALFDTDGRAVAGVVVSGDATSVTIMPAGEALEVLSTHEGLGSALVAQYLLSYEVADENATRYAAVQEVARQDAQEIGMAYLVGNKAAGVGWAGSRAQIDVARDDGLGALWDRLGGTDDTWSLAVDAPSRNGGKWMRVVLPASVSRDGAFQVAIDGRLLEPSSVAAVGDDDSLVVTFEIDHFSLRNVQIRTITPGVSPLFAWLSIGFGTALVGTSTLFAGLQLKSRAALRGAGITPEGRPGGVRSRAAQRALAAGRVGDPGEVSQFKSRVLQRLSQEGAVPFDEKPRAETPADAGETRVIRGGFSPCGRCGGPVKFAEGQAEITCTSCGQNTRNPRAPT